MRALAQRLAAGLRARPALVAAMVYAVLAIAFVGPGLVPGHTYSSADTLWFQPPWVDSKPAHLEFPSNTDLNDEQELMHPFLREAAKHMPGDVPLWNPHIAGGRPFHANAQSALFGPYTWPVYILPFQTAVGWIAVLKLWVAGFGMFLLARALGMRFGGALMAGLVFAFSLKLTTWLIYPAMSVWTFYPWLLWCVERYVRRPGALTGAALAVVVALQFLSGHPESSFQALFITVAFFALRTWQARRELGPSLRRLARPLLGFCAALAGGACLAAVSLVPVGELVLNSADFVDRRGGSIDKALPFEDVLSLFFPDFWGRATQTPFRALLLERALYVGALPLMLAVVALLRRRMFERVAVAAFGAFWLAVVLGVPPFVQLVTRLPVFSAGHNTRLMVYSILALALLAGWGLDELSDRSEPLRRVRLRTAAIAGAIVAVPVVTLLVFSPNALGVLPRGVRVAWLFEDLPGSFRDLQALEVVRSGALVVWVTVAGAALVLVAGRLWGRLRPAAFVALAFGLVCADLFRAGVGYNPAIERRDAEQPTTGAIRYLERRRPARFVSTDAFTRNVIAFRSGLYEARGYDVPIVRRYDRLWRAEVTPELGSVAADFLSIPLRFPEVTPRALRTLRLLGVTDVLAPKSVWPEKPPFRGISPSAPLHDPGLAEVYDGDDARVYRLDGALPRAWVAGSHLPVNGPDVARRTVTRPGFDVRRVAVTERRLPGLPVTSLQAAARPAGRARIERYADERVVLSVDSRRQGLAVLADTYYPGWKAKVDGRSAAVEPVDSVFRGVRVGPGRHTVEFRYEPLSWRLGWIISMVSLGVLAVVLALCSRPWRRRGSRP